MNAYYSDRFVLPLPQGHRFPMAKYERLRTRLVAAGVLDPADLHIPDAATDEQLLRVHTSGYLKKVVAGRLTPREIRRIGFPWSLEMVERSRRSVGGTLAACRAALADGTAANLAGGTHHAFPDHGEGFCVFNDVAVALRQLLADGAIAHAVVIDCDVHQGNGTAAVFQDDPAVYTFSIHGAKNFPFRKQSSDLDLAMPDGTGDEVYLETLDEALWRVIDQANADFAVYLAGADAYAGDSLGHLALSKAGMLARDQLVLAACRQADLPVAVVMGGGYAPDIEDTVDIHCATVAAAVGCCASTRSQPLEKAGDDTIPRL
jgi:acetoin utilization deacetylase AcuC-like enzyme